MQLRMKNFLNTKLHSLIKILLRKNQQSMSYCKEATNNQRLCHLLNHVERKKIPQKNLDNLWYRMEARINQEQTSSQSFFNINWSRHHRPLFIKPAFAILIMVIIFLGSTTFLMRHSLGIVKIGQNNIEQYEVLKVGCGERIRVSLSDGTRIILDSGSELRYPKEFSVNRDVYLKGEAFFDVAHDIEHPFVVHANHARIQVVGTRFNVRTWEESPNVMVVVEDGKVKLSNALASSSESVLLTRNQMSAVARDGVPTDPVKAIAQEHLGWMQNEIVFENATINEVFSQLERWYDFKFSLQDSSILNERVSVHLVKTNIDDVLDVVSILTNSKITRDSSLIIIDPKNR